MQDLRLPLFAAVFALAPTLDGPALAEELPAGTEPMPALSLRWMFLGHTSAEKDRYLYWGSGSRIYAVRGELYGKGTWFADEGQVCYSITWVQGHLPVQSTTSQGGGFTGPEEEVRCTAYEVGAGMIYRRFQTGAGQPLSDWGDAGPELSALRSGNLIRERFVELMAGFPD